MFNYYLASSWWPWDYLGNCGKNRKTTQSFKTTADIFYMYHLSYFWKNSVNILFPSIISLHIDWQVVGSATGILRCSGRVFCCYICCCWQKCECWIGGPVYFLCIASKTHTIFNKEHLILLLVLCFLEWSLLQWHKNIFGWCFR